MPFCKLEQPRHTTEPAPTTRSIRVVRLCLTSADAEHLRRLAEEVDCLCRRPNLTLGQVAELDLSELGDVSVAVRGAVNGAFHALEAAGFIFRVAPPRAAGPRTAFLRAALRQEFGWAQGSAHRSRRTWSPLDRQVALV